MSDYDFDYIQLIGDILSFGTERPDRTGVGSIATFGKSFTVDLKEGFPILTTRKVAFRIAFEETMFFLRGQTDTKQLEEKRINIWKGNTSREFLDKVGLHYLPSGNMGKGYGFQWRNFGGTADNDGVDQVLNLLKGLQTDPNGRRHIVSAWNPQQLHETALVPCHLYQQYQVLDDKLNSMFLMRSVDTMYGLPYNIMSYAFLNILFSKYLKLMPGTLTFMGGDVHIYLNQREIAEEQFNRHFDKYELPIFNINKDINTINDIFSLEYSDVELIGYESYPDFENKPPMAV